MIENKFNIKVISPNTQLKYNLSLKKYNQDSENLFDIAILIKIKTLFVWPEGVFSGYSFEEIYKLKKTISDNFDQNHYILLV